MSFMKMVRTANSLVYMKRWVEQAHKQVQQMQANPTVIGIWEAIGIGILLSPIWGGALWVFYKLAYDYNMPITAFIVAMMGLGMVAYIFTVYEVDEPNKVPAEPNTASSDEIYADGWKSEDFD